MISADISLYAPLCQHAWSLYQYDDYARWQRQRIGHGRRGVVFTTFYGCFGKPVGPLRRRWVYASGDGCGRIQIRWLVFRSGFYETPLVSCRVPLCSDDPQGFYFARFQIDGHTPLDGNGTANCYIARALNTGYSFNARVKGNGKSTTGITASALNGTTARVIWESGTGFGSVVRYAIYDHGRIYFRPVRLMAMPSSASLTTGIGASGRGISGLWIMNRSIRPRPTRREPSSWTATSVRSLPRHPMS